MTDSVEAAISALRERIDRLQAGIDHLGAELLRVRAVEQMLQSHLPRPDGRPGFVAQFNIADLMAWRAAESSAAFVEEHMPTAAMLGNRHENLAFGARHTPPEGMVLEFGVGDGTSLRWLQDLHPGRRVVGFDSFEGLPEDWRTGFPRGAFGSVRALQLERAELRVGWFEDTINPFLAESDDPIAFMHVDCDLYSSTVTVLDACMPRLASGAVVVFDEFLNYHGWQQHEAKAWIEYLARHRRDIRYLSYVPTSEQIALLVLS